MDNEQLSHELTILLISKRSFHDAETIVKVYLDEKEKIYNLLEQDLNKEIQQRSAKIKN